MKKSTTMYPELAHFGELVRVKRKELGMTAEQLAEKANRCDRQIIDIENGKTEPLFGTALLLCQACKIDMGELEAFIPNEEIKYG